jgi:tRNA G18 (ribose-2'-O)-methylase SpoU
LILVRDLRDEGGNESCQTSPSSSLEAMLDNIRSAWNVGSMFRTADGLGIRRLHLCGLTPTPENAKVIKTSLGGERNVAWRYYRDGVAAATALVAQGYRLWALERHPGAQPLAGASRHLPGPPIVLVVGNEVCGVDPGILEQCERVVYIPMSGVKHSFNVAVAFGIAAHVLDHADRQITGERTTHR